MYCQYVDVKQYFGYCRKMYQKVFVEMLGVVIGNQYGWNFQFGGGVYYQFCQFFWQMQFVNDKQWYVNDVQVVSILYQGVDVEQQ